MGGNDEEPPSPVAVAQCNLIVNLIMGAVWLGLWLGYGKAENCDKDLRLWYDLFLGGMLFGLARRRRRRSCQTGKQGSAKSV